MNIAIFRALNVVALTFFLAGAQRVAAVPITSASVGDTVTDFSTFAGANLFTAGPVVLENGVVWTSQVSNSVVYYSGGYGLGPNGDWNSGGPNGFAYAGTNDSVAAMFFAFDSPVTQVGAFLNYAPGDTFTISVLDTIGNTIESLQIDGDATFDILTPGALNAGAFRGFNVGSPIIQTFVVQGAFAVATDLSFNANASTVVPELDASSSALPLLFLCTSGLLLGDRRRRQASAKFSSRL